MKLVQDSGRRADSGAAPTVRAGLFRLGGYLVLCPVLWLASAELSAAGPWMAPASLILAVASGLAALRCKPFVVMLVLASLIAPAALTGRLGVGRPALYEAAGHSTTNEQERQVPHRQLRPLPL